MLKESLYERFIRLEQAMNECSMYSATWTELRDQLFRTKVRIWIYQFFWSLHR